MTARVNPELKALVADVSRALAMLDAERLEELAQVCQELTGPCDDRAEIDRQARDSAGEMAVLERVLEATRANLEVMRRLRDLREGRAGYGVGASDGNH